MKELLAGKTFMVAGAGGLLGSHIVKGAMEQKAHIIAVDTNLESMSERLEKLGIDTNSELLNLRFLDITDQGSVVEAFKNFGDLHGAVNATYPRSSSYGKHFFDVSYASFNENVSLHLGSAFLFAQQCAAYFKTKKKPFSLVNISSIYGVVAPQFDVYDNTSMTMPVEYAAIKSAIQHLSKYIAAYIGDSRFRVNCVSPGGIFDNQPTDFIAAYKLKTNGNGMLNVEEVVGSVMFLLSNQSNFVTGQNLIVDDGFSL
ncbi:oxidoreductase [Agarivorans sp. JK6]|uniref:oxidoreductase n=1 Tax=Agarivorans sp. JK6 TaxID=2997426 RepID=UPI00387374EC